VCGRVIFVGLGLVVGVGPRHGRSLAQTRGTKTPAQGASPCVPQLPTSMLQRNTPADTQGGQVEGSGWISNPRGETLDYWVQAILRG